MGTRPKGGRTKTTQSRKTRFDRRRFLQGTAAAGGTFALASALPLRARAQVPSFSLGQIAPFTGSAAEFGEFYRDAAALAVEHVNAAAEEVFGAPIIAQHIAEDTDTLPTPAIESARKLVEADGVPAIVDGNKSTKELEAVGGGDLAGSLGTTPGQDPNIPRFQNFSVACEARFGRDRIPPFTESAYAAATIGLAAAKAIVDGESELAGTVLRDRLRGVANPQGDAVIGGSQDAITQGMKAIKDGRDIDYSCAAGACSFDDNGDVITPQAIWQFTEDGTETVQVVPAEEIPSE